MSSDLTKIHKKYVNGCGQIPLSHFYVPSDQNLVQYNEDLFLKFIVFNLMRKVYSLYHLHAMK